MVLEENVLTQRTLLKLDKVDFLVPPLITYDNGIMQIGLHYELISKYNVGLKTLLGEGLSEPEFYGDLVYQFNELIGRNDFSFQFRKIITRYRRIGYNLNVMRQSACLVFKSIMVDHYAAFLNCTPVGRASDSMMAPTYSF